MCHFFLGKQSLESSMRTAILTFPINNLFRGRLRGRLFLRRKTVRRIPWIYGACDSHTRKRYSCQHSHFWWFLLAFRPVFVIKQNVPLPFKRISIKFVVSVDALSPDTFSALSCSTSELLRFLQRMAASKPTSWLSLRENFFSHSGIASGP